MQDKDFDGLLKRKFEFLEGTPTPGKAWTELSAQLDAFDDQRRRKAKLGYALLLTVLLLGHLAWVLYWLGSGSEKPATSSLQHTIYSQDTIVQTIPIVKYDTIYRTIIKENHQIRPALYQNISMAPKSSPSLISTDSPSYSNIPPPKAAQTSAPEKNTDQIYLAENSIHEGTPELSLTPGNSNHYTAKSTIPSIVQHSPDTSGTQNIPEEAAYSLNTPADDSELFILEQNESDTAVYSSTPAQSSDKISSKNASDAKPTTTRKLDAHWELMWISGYNSLLFPNKLQGFVLSSGLQIERNISSRLAVGGSLRFGLVSAESTDIDQLIIPGNDPSLNPPTGFLFSEWDADFVPLVNYHLYTHFRLANMGKTRLMSGAGAQWVSTLPHTIDYLYFNPDNLNEFDLEVEKDWDTRWQGLTLFLQAERPLSKRFALGMRASGLIPAQPPQSVLDQQLGLDLWLKFKL